MRNKIFKTLFYVLAAGALVLVIGAAITQTRLFKNWLRAKIISHSRELINGTLQLGRIDGNLLTRFSFDDLIITQDQDTVLAVPRLQVALQPFALLSRQLRLSLVRLDSPRLFVRQLPDSSLNVAHVLRSAAELDTSSAATKWTVHLGDISLNGARIEYISLDTLQQRVPRLIRVIRAHVHGAFVKERLFLTVDDLQLDTFAPNMELRSVCAEIAAGGDSMRLTNFTMRTANSQVKGDIAIKSLTAADFSIDLMIAPLLLEELHPFFPKLKTTGEVNGRVYATKSASAIRAEADLHYGATSARMFGTWDNADSSYTLEAVVQQLDLAAFGIDTTRHASVNARLTAMGRGIDWPQSTARAIVWLDTSRVAGFRLPRLEIEAQLAAGHLQTRADYYSALGAASVDAEILDLFGVQAYEFQAKLKNFDLTRFLTTMTSENLRSAPDEHFIAPSPPHTKLSLTCVGIGRSFDPANVEMAATLHATASEIGVTTLDSLRASLHVRDGNMHIDSLRWYSPTAALYATGVVSFGLACDLRFRGELGDLELIRQVVEADSLRASGIFSGTMSGPAESLLVKADFALRDVQWNTSNLQRVNGKMTYSHSVSGGTVTADGGGLLFGVVPLDTATAHIQYDLDKMDFQSSCARGTQDYGEIDGRYTFGGTARLDIHRAEIFLLGQAWKNSDAPMWIDIGDEAYDLHNVILRSGEQRVFAEGRLDYLGEEDLQLGIENLNVANIAAFLDHRGDFEGGLNASGHLFGTASAPLLQGKFDLRNARIAEFRFPLAHGTIGYADERFFWDFELAQSATRTLIGEGFLPMNLALDNTGDILFLDRPMRIQFSTNDLDLSFLQTLVPQVKNLNGSVAFNIAAENNLLQPLPLGFVRIMNGGFAVPKYGIQYRHVHVSVVVDTSFVELQSFEMASGGGKLTAEGRMNFTSEAISGIEASLHAENFMVMHNRDVDLRINADINVGGTLNAAGFAGDVTVARSRFFLPALQPTAVMQVDEKLPVASAADCTKVAANRLTDLLNKSYGELRVLIPRNTWLRGPEINVEIEGELDLVVDGDAFLLFGTINVVRGTYELYGNKFIIEKGALTFQGAKEMLPEINLDATRSFRNLRTKEKQTLRIKITGNPTAPKITFQRDDDTIEEKDALAYLFFGVSFDELARGQKTEVAGQDNVSPVMSAASGLITGLVSKQITNSLAKNLNLDVIEFQSGEDLDFKQSTVLVGKYITNDLFLSYSRDFSSADAQKVALEYEIAKFLFLQAAKSNEKDTGFDVIWKWEW